MELADVVGSVTATVKAASLQQHKLLAVRAHDPPGGRESDLEVAVDTVGAGPGDRVLIVRGSTARQPPETRATATDLTVVAIVDTVDVAVPDPEPPRRRT
jgi:carbon dioxide concentrating mechanism protein CcmL